MYLIDNNQLNSLCNYLARTTYIYYPVAINFNKDLLHTGCRPEEVLTIGLWTYISSVAIELQPLKGNGTRTFIESDLTPGLVFAIQNNIKPYEGLTLRQLESVNKKILPVATVGTSAKSAISYIFRYNYIKQLYIQGYSDAAITAKMGYALDSVTVGYRTRLLYTSTPLPVMNNIYRLHTELITTGNVGATATDVYPYTIPAGTFVNYGDSLTINVYGSFTDDTHSEQLAFNFLGVPYNMVSTFSNLQFHFQIVVVWKTATTYDIYQSLNENITNVYMGLYIDEVGSLAGALATKLVLQGEVTNDVIVYTATYDFTATV
jgi:hypothetical protein